MSRFHQGRLGRENRPRAAAPAGTRACHRRGLSTPDLWSGIKAGLRLSVSLLSPRNMAKQPAEGRGKEGQRRREKGEGQEEGQKGKVRVETMFASSSFGIQLHTGRKDPSRDTTPRGWASVVFPSQWGSGTFLFNEKRFHLYVTKLSHYF